MKILDSRWLGSLDPIGIVLIEEEDGKNFVKIGTCLIRYQEQPNEKIDSEFIAEHGAKLGFTEAVGFFPYLDKDKYK
jgi:hypothetical protein